MPPPYSTSIPITDSSGRVIGVLVGRPDDSSWEHVHLAAADDIEAARREMEIPKGATSHRRGRFYAEAVGATMGPGARVNFAGFLPGLILTYFGRSTPPSLRTVLLTPP